MKVVICFSPSLLFHKRTMMHATLDNLASKAARSSAQAVSSHLNSHVSQPYTTEATKFKGPAKKFSNDNGTGHTHICINTCISPSCTEKKCPSLCDKYRETQVRGHDTHKPPIGRFCRFVAAEDANGDAKPQYFIKANKKLVITPEEKEEYAKHIKSSTKQQAFINKHLDKYE